MPMTGIRVMISKILQKENRRPPSILATNSQVLVGYFEGPQEGVPRHFLPAKLVKKCAEVDARNSMVTRSSKVRDKRRAGRWGIVRAVLDRYSAKRSGSMRGVVQFTLNVNDGETK